VGILGATATGEGHTLYCGTVPVRLFPSPLLRGMQTRRSLPTHDRRCRRGARRGRSGSRSRQDRKKRQPSQEAAAVSRGALERQRPHLPIRGRDAPEALRASAGEGLPAGEGGRLPGPGDRADDHEGARGAEAGSDPRLRRRPAAGPLQGGDVGLDRARARIKAARKPVPADGGPFNRRRSVPPIPRAAPLSSRAPWRSPRRAAAPSCRRRRRTPSQVEKASPASGRRSSATRP
jgi:hypothetical protein